MVKVPTVILGISCVGADIIKEENEKMFVATKVRKNVENVRRKNKQNLTFPLLNET